MGKLKRVLKTITFISDDVPRVLSRAKFFNFGALGDLGAKSKRERDLKKILAAKRGSLSGVPR